MVQSMRNRDTCGRIPYLDMSIDSVLNDYEYLIRLYIYIISDNEY